VVGLLGRRFLALFAEQRFEDGLRPLAGALARERVLLILAVARDPSHKFSMSATTPMMALTITIKPTTSVIPRPMASLRPFHPSLSRLSSIALNLVDRNTN
jgi:hypothetical protein